MKKSVCISTKTVFDLSAIYLFLPILVQMLGWTKLLFAIPAGSAMVAAVILTRKRSGSHRSITAKRGSLILVGCLCLFVGIAAGWGGLTPQPYDWHKHNALFRDLVNKPWPVIYRNNGVTSMLTYYLAQYMIPAVAGKAFLLICPGAASSAFIFAEGVMLIWNCLGLYLVMLHVLILTESSRPALTLLVFVLFGSLLPIGRAVVSLLLDPSISPFDLDHNLDVNLIAAQYSTNFVQLRWVFPQCLAAWIVMGIFLEGIISVDGYVVLGLPLLLFSSFPFIGVLPFFIAAAVRLLAQGTKFKAWIKMAFSIPNVLMLLSVGVFSALYFWGYIFAADKPDILRFTVNSFTIPAYLVFVLSTFAVQMLLLLPAIKIPGFFDKLFYWVAGAVLLILPLYRMGVANDFTMRVSIPAQFVLCVAFIKALSDVHVQRMKGYWAALLIVFLIGIIYPAMEMESAIIGNSLTDHQELADEYESLEFYANPDLKNTDPVRFYLNNGYTDILYNYYTYGENMKYFTKTIGK